MLRRPLAFAFVALLSPIACGGDDDGGQPDDGGGNDAAPDGIDASPGQPDAAAGSGCPATIHASFDLSSSSEYGQLHGAYDDVPWPTALEEKMREGECAFFAPEPPFCDPVCAGETLCSAGSVCRPFPQHIDIGTVRVAGTDPELVLEANQFDYYLTETQLPSLYQPGDELTLTAGGEGDVPAIDVTVRGVAPLAEPGLVTAREHEDLVITWEPDPSASEGTELILHADNDHHGLQAYIECRGPDDGELVIPAAVLDQLILAGETGIGTYIENAWMKRINQATVETDRGCASFQSIWQVPVGFETIRAD